MRTTNIFAGTLCTVALFASVSASAALVIPEREVKAPEKPYSPYVNDYYPQNIYFGDTHLHTAWSADAGMAGATLTPEDAYRVARGAWSRARQAVR